MIKLVLFEIKKIIKNKLLVILMLLLVLANAVLVFGEIPKDKRQSEKRLCEFVALYKSDPDYFEEYIAKYDEAYASALERAYRFYESEPNYPENVYSDNDNVFFHSDFESIKNIDVLYKSALENAEKIAFGRISEYEYLGYTKNSFEMRYQQMLLDSYDKASQINLPMENVVGYDIFFESESFAAFMLIALALCGIMLIIPEKSGGMLLIMRSCKNGRAKTFLAKIIAGALISVVLSAVFSFSTLVVICAKVGLRGYEFPIQMIDSMKFCPYFLSIGDGVALVMLARAFSSFAFLCATIIFSVILIDYISAFAASAAFGGLNYFFGTYNYLNTYGVINNLNFFESIDGTKYISSFCGVKIFNRCVPFTPFIIFVYSLLIVMAAVFGAMIFLRVNISRKSAKILCFDILKKVQLKKPRYSVCILRYELKKIFTPLCIAVLAILVLSTAYLSDANFNFKRNYEQNIYAEYMTSLRGEWSTEKHEKIKSDMDSINEIIGKKTYMEAAYESGEINQGEYGEWLSEYFISESRADGVRKVYEHSEYLKELHDRGIDVYFFDGTGYELLQKTNISFLLCAALILIFADVFSYEYRCGFYAIQQSEKFGKKKDVFMKYIAVLAISAILGLLFEAVQYIYVDVFWDLSGVSYPVMCIEKTNVSREISVGAYFLLSSIRNVLFYTLTALFAGTVSRLSKRVILSLAVPTVVIFVPTVLAYFGVEIFEKINFLNLFAR